MSIPREKLDLIADTIEKEIEFRENGKYEFLVLVFNKETDQCDFISSMNPEEAMLNCAEWMKGMLKMDMSDILNSVGRAPRSASRRKDN